MSILRKVLTSNMLAATILGGSLAIASSASAQSSYGGVKFTGPAYTFKGQSGQYGNAVFFGARPTTLPSHSGQSGNVTFLGGVRPTTYPSHSGQVGNVTHLGARPAGTVPTPIIRTPNIVRIK